MNGNIFTIQAGRPFAKVLAGALLKETKDNPQSLSQYLLLLPTRRACRILQEAFLDLETKSSLLLPRMQPVGDLDEEELSLSLLSKNNGEDWSIPPTLPTIKRQILLAELIQKLHPQNSQEQSLKLAQALGRLMDQIYTDNLDMADLANLAPLDFADHWQITLKFLEILSENWPKILNELNVIDAADRRNRLILKLAEHWEENPPQTHIIGAGSTGSIPSTARLLSVISTLPNGRLILPGVDKDMDDESWNAMDETHPQFGFRELLSKIKIDRLSVQNFETDNEENRATLARELMRPAETTQTWAELSQNKNTQETLKDSLKNLHRIDCENIQEEALCIATLMRETLEVPDKTACLITPDRALATRVSEICKRWDITLDDSAGQHLKTTPLGTFFLKTLEAVQSDFAPRSLLALLKHRYTHIENKSAVNHLDEALRGLKPQKGFDGLIAHINAHERISETVKDHATSCINEIRPIFENPQYALNTPSEFTAFLKKHIALCEKLCGNADMLWSGEIGQKTAQFLSTLLEQTQNMQITALEDYRATFEHFMDQLQLRPAFGTHPRLQILGQLEARLIDADLVIMGSLNEKSWPPEASNDPWMSRPMRKEFGLPSLERGVGLSAHDFVQGLCNKKVVLTRSIKIDGAPTVPSRWLQRLDTVMDGADLKLNETHPVQHWAKNIDGNETVRPISAPAPKPPTELRPKELSATRIEVLLRDPYAIYAQKILKLESLKPMENDIDAATRGTLLHKILDRFVKKTPSDINEQSKDTLIQIANEETKKLGQADHNWSFWWSRFYKSVDWLLEHEQKHRENIQHIETEADGKTDLNGFTITARADRIDKTKDGQAVIIDYKSGGQYSQTKMQNGALPQLPIEAVILNDGGFKNLGALNATSLEYWVFKGKDGGTTTHLKGDLSDLITETKDNLTALIQSYNDPEMPYSCQPRPDQAPEYNDYEHLERIKEWGVTGDQDTESEAA